ncbi:MAG: hypothetical protein KME30_04345 [Iphinoe sp. HA4291-MV1]|jgi:hypothetical protein|nr:hypothetical protein [Iphinoe sp. HA4291-MV1]
MNTLFTEIADSEATSVVGGGFLSSADFLSVNADATALSEASTVFFDTGYPQTSADTFVKLDDFSSKSGSRSAASIYYDDAPIY